MSRRRPTQLRSDLRAMSADAGAFSVMVGIGETYLPAFALAVGVGEVAAGLLASVPPLAGAILQLASPAAVRRLGSHRRWVVVCAVTQALSFVPLIAAALAGRIPTVLIFLVATLYWGSGMGTGPAWNTWVGTLVPSRLRAGYFSRRTRITQIGVLGGLLLGGAVLEAGTEIGQRLHAFALLFLGAAACRVASARLLAATSEPIPLPQNYRRVPAAEALGRLVRRSPEGRLLLYLLSVQTAVNLSAPYFTPYMLGQLRLSYAEYMALVAASFGAKILMLPLLGALARRFGARHLLWVGGLGIIPLASLWIVSDWYNYLLGVQCVAGTAWGAYELATFLLVFETIRGEERTSVLTTFNLANALAMVAGSLLGGWLLAHLGEHRSAYWAIFALSSLARAGTVLFLVRVPTPTLVAVPVATRTVAVRPSAGSIDRPILPSIRKAEDEDEASPSRPSATARSPGVGGSSASVPGARITH
ncbi:MAG TPA: MFS transporter [Deltaproteobacteria bacterium]|nr:MFS transporter [Deltaproteobacteria bacterium]